MNRSTSMVFAALLLLTGCPANNGAPDAGTDAAIDATDATDSPDASPDTDRSDAADIPPAEILGSRVPTRVQDGVSPDGATDVDTPISGEARVGRLTGATGFTGLWSHCKTGDLKLYNGEVEVCVSNERSNRYEMFAGGGLVDARTVGTTSDDVFDLYAPRIGFNTLHAETVAVIRDGSDGGPAVIRAEGTDMPAAYFVGVAGEQAFQPKGLTVWLEYRLGPDSDFVEIVTFIQNDTEDPISTQRGDLLAFGDRAIDFREGSGLDAQVSNEPFHWIAAAGPGHSFAWVVPDEPLDSLSSAFGNPPWELTQTDSMVLEPGGRVVHFGRMFIGDGSVDGVVTRARQYLVKPAGDPREVTVVDADGQPVVGRWVEVNSEDEEPVTAGRTDDDGTVTLHIPDGPYAFVIRGVVGGGEIEETRDVSADALDFEVPTAATVRVETTVDGSPAIAAVTAAGVEGASYEGALEFQMMPGEVPILVEKGPEYDQASTTVTAVAGEVVTAQLNLTRELDTTDWIAGDFHQHMEPSSDSTVNVGPRILDNIAQGIELLVPTDHDVVTDLVPYIGELGLGEVLSTFPGAELSPSIAHTNAYPLPWDATLPGRGTVPLAVLEDGEPRRRTVPELIAAARQLPTDPVIQINHPRDSSGLFEHVDFDPELGPDAVDNRWWTTDFDAMEVINGDECLEYKDWSGLWNAGLTPTPIGSSDSHGLWGDAGSDRTYLYMPAVAPGEVGADDARDAVRDGRVVVAGHAFIEFTDGTLPGDSLTDTTGQPVDFGLKVQSPSWASIDQIQVVVNGEITQEVDVTPVSGILDFDGTVSVDEADDFWVSFLAAGPDGNYAFTNAVRVDRDGDGFVAPGPKPLQLDALALCQ